MTAASDDALESRRIALFLAVAFGVAAAVGGYVYAAGGLADSPPLAPGLPITVATALIATVYMFSPAVANAATRLLTGEGRRDLMLRPRVRRRWRSYLLAWLGPPALTVVGAAAYFWLFPGQFDPGLTALGESLTAAAAEPPLDPRAAAAATVVAALTVGALVNSVVTFGEEFGWRGYLLPKLLPLGVRTAVVLHGAIWGVWHWPVVAMGYNYGLDYPGAPWVGLLAMVWATTAMGAFLAWVTLRSGSVWPATLGHAVINAFAGVPMLLVRGDPALVLGPAPVGVVGSLGFVAVAALLLARPSRLAAGGEDGDGDGA